MPRELFLKLVLVISVILIGSILGFSLARYYGILPRTEITLEGSLNITGGGRGAPYQYIEPETWPIPSKEIPCVEWIRIKNLLTASKYPMLSRYNFTLDVEGKLKNEFRQGDAIWIYFEYEYYVPLEKFGGIRCVGVFSRFESQERAYIETENETIIVAHTSFNLSIMDEEGNVIMRAGDITLASCGSGLSAGDRYGAFYVFGGRFPFSCEPGKYRIVATVIDQLTGKTDQRSVNITILKGEHKEHKEPHFYPISTPPEVLALQAEELPGKWEEIYSYNWSCWDPFYEEEVRLVDKQFLRTDGNNVTILIMIKEFETRESAEREFKEFLEVFNLSNRWGLAERISSIPGARSFTYVDYEPYTGLRTFSVYSLIENVVITVTGGGYVHNVTTPSPSFEEVLDIVEMQESKVVGG